MTKTKSIDLEKLYEIANKNDLLDKWNLKKVMYEDIDSFEGKILAKDIILEGIIFFKAFDKIDRGIMITLREMKIKQIETFSSEREDGNVLMDVLSNLQ